MTFSELAAEARQTVLKAASIGLIQDYKPPTAFKPKASGQMPGKRRKKYVRKRVCKRHRSPDTLPKVGQTGPQGRFLRSWTGIDEEGPFWREQWVSEDKWQAKYARKQSNDEYKKQRFANSKTLALQEWLLSLKPGETVSSPFGYAMTHKMIWRCKKEAIGNWTTKGKGNPCFVTRIK